jgi:hypothetical protein
MSTKIPDWQSTAQLETALLKPDGSVNWLKDRLKCEHARRLRLNKQTVRDNARRHPLANTDKTPYGEVMDGLLDKGKPASMIGK